MAPGDGTASQFCGLVSRASQAPVGTVARRQHVDRAPRQNIGVCGVGARLARWVQYALASASSASVSSRRCAVIATSSGKIRTRSS